MILSFGVAETRAHGPEPTGLASKPLGSAVTSFCGTILTVASRSANSGKAYLSANSTVLASTFVTLDRNGTNSAISEALAGFSTRSKLNTTSSAVTGEPSWKVAPLRRVTRYVVGLTASGIAVARAG